MANIYDLVKSHISEDMISKAAAMLGDNEQQISQATNKIIPTLLAEALTKKSAKVDGVVEEAHKIGVLDNAAKLFAGEADEKTTSLGDRFVAAVMGDKEPAIHSLVAGDELMSDLNAGKLVSMIGAIVAGVLGRHSGYMNDLDGGKTAIFAAIPEEWKRRLGLKMPVAAAAKAAPAAPAKPAVEKKKKSHWWWWLILLLLVLLLIWALRQCKSCNIEREAETVTVVEKPQPVQESNEYVLELPTGEKLTVIKGSMIDKMVVFLRSDKYKNATDEELKKNWFEFENLDFVFNSGTEFVEGSDQCVNCLAFVLKYFPDAKIKIGGNADHKGGEGVNTAISKERAATIKKVLLEKGIATDRVSTEGFGEEYAVIPATSTDAERAPDRDIALRFVK